MLTAGQRHRHHRPEATAWKINRTSDTSIGPRVVRQGSGYGVDTGTTTESYGYDGLDRLSTTVRDGTLIDTRLYDAANRVLLSGPVTGYMNLPTAYTAAHQQGVLASKLNPALPDLGGPVIGRTSRYDANGQMVEQKNHEYGTLTNGTLYDRYDNEGNAASYLSADIGSVTQSRTNNVIDRAEGYRTRMALTETVVVAGAGTGSKTVGGIAYLYDTNGHLARTVDANQITSPTHRAHSFVNDASGNALYAYYSDDRNPGPQLNAQRQLIVNGEVLGRYGAEATQRFGNLLGPQFEAKSEFSFGYQPINGNYPAGSPGTYAVAAGDTLQSIAKGAYGDANLWYLIADANGLSSSADLRSGQVLTIPTRVASANNANSFKPYDPSNIIGDTSPTLMAVPGHGDQGCGGVGQLVVIVIAVVVAFVVGPEVLPVFEGALGSGVAATAAAGATGAAAGSIASQAVGVTIGTQDRFSWKQVALSAVGGGVTAGLGNFAPTGNVIADAAIRGAAANAATQGIAVATGLQSSFNWRSVAASAAGSGVGQAVGGALNSSGAFNDSLGAVGGVFARGAVAGFAAGLTTAAMRGGRISATQVATDAFGNALGSSLARSNSSGDVLGDFIAKNNNFAGSSYNFADSMAARQADLNPLGLPTSAGNSAGDNPAYALDYRNGSDIASDNYDGSRRTATVRNGQGPLAALADLGLNSAQQHAGYGYLLKTGQVQLGRDGVPMVQPGQQLHIDLDDMSQASLAGRAIAQESSMRADRAAAAAQVATAVNAGAYPNMDARDLRNNFGYQSMLARGFSDLGSMSSANYADARASTLSPRETAVDWVRSVVGTDRAGNVIAGAVNGWLAGGEAMPKIPDAIAAIPSAVTRLAKDTASAATQLWNDPVGAVTNTMASGVDGFRTNVNQAVNGNGFSLGSGLFAIGAMGVPLGRVEGALETAGLDWSRVSLRTGGDAAEHVTLNHGSLSFTKPNQGVFYGNPVATVEDAWGIAQRNEMNPVTIGNRDFYVVPRPNSGYAGGMGGQLNNLDHVTIITESGTPRVVTSYPSGGTPPLPRGYNFLLGI